MLLHAPHLQAVVTVAQDVLGKHDGSVAGRLWADLGAAVLLPAWGEAHGIAVLSALQQLWHSCRAVLFEYAP